MKRIVAILGSPRKWGNTELLLEEFLKEFKGKPFTVQKIACRDLKVTPCTNCGYCLKKGVCVFKDDMRRVYKELETADCVVIASPIYFTSVSAQLKVLLDRCQVFWSRFFILKKHVKSTHPRYGVFLSVCGFSKPSMFQCAVRMIAILFKVVNVDFYGRVTCPGVDKKGDILKKAHALKRARTLARNIIKELSYGKGT